MFAVHVIKEFYDIITDEYMLINLGVSPGIYKEYQVFDQYMINSIEVYEQDMILLEANRELFGISLDTYIISY